MLKVIEQRCNRTRDSCMMLIGQLSFASLSVEQTTNMVNAGVKKVRNENIAYKLTAHEKEVSNGLMEVVFPGKIAKKKIKNILKVTEQNPD